MKLLAILIITILISGCLSTEPITQAPYINLSPEKIDWAIDSDQKIDFGWRLSTNESDSLENLTVLPGVRIDTVRTASTAENAGIKAGDILLRLNDTEVNSPDEVVALSLQNSPPLELRLTLRRDSSVYQTRIKTPPRTVAVTPEELYRIDPLKLRAGFTTSAINNNGNPQTGAVIVGLDDSSPLKDTNIELGDIIYAVNGEPIRSAQGLINFVTNQLDYGEQINLSIVTKTFERREITVKLWQPKRIVTDAQIWPLFDYEASAENNRVSFELIDLFFFDFFSYERNGNEKTIEILSLIRFSSGLGELLESPQP